MSVTIAELKDRTGLELDDAAAKALYSAIKRVEESGGHDDVDEVLELTDRLINEQGEYSAFGVEPLRAEGAWDSYYGDAVALYVNTGDTYNPTLLYDVEQHEFFVTSWGDWVEQYEREKEAEAANVYLIPFSVTDGDNYTVHKHAAIEATSKDEALEWFVTHWVGWRGGGPEEEAWGSIPEYMEGSSVEKMDGRTYYITGTDFDAYEEDEEPEHESMLLTVDSEDVEEFGSKQHFEQWLEEQDRRRARPIDVSVEDSV